MRRQISGIHTIIHLAQDTTWKHNTQESQEVSSFPEGDHKDAMYRQDSMTDTKRNNKKDPQKKHRLGMVSNYIITGGLKLVLWYQPQPNF